MQAIAGPLSPDDVPDQAALEDAYAPPAGFGPAAGGWVRANMTTSLDGAAHLDGLSGGLSGAADKRVFGALRALADVVLVGSGTVTAEGYGPATIDDEAQARRVARGQAPVPIIAVVSASLRMDPTTPLFQSPTTIVLTCTSAPAQKRAAFTCEVVDCGSGEVAIDAALAALAERGLVHVLCEGGPTLLAQLIASGHLDELDLTFAPKLAGPGAGRIVAGPDSPAGTAPAVDASLVQLLTEDGFLFARYLLNR